jgi:hypothetical protein
VLGLQDPFSTGGSEKSPVNTTVAAWPESLKPDAFVGADEVSAEHLELFVIETRKVVVVH